MLSVVALSQLRRLQYYHDTSYTIEEAHQETVYRTVLPGREHVRAGKLGSLRKLVKLVSAERNT